MEDVPELISQVRDHYLQQFLGFVKVQQEQWRSGHAEVKFELSDQSERSAGSIALILWPGGMTAQSSEKCSRIGF